MDLRSIIGFSDYRPDKIEEPFSSLGGLFQTVTIPTTNFSPVSYLRSIVLGIQWIRRLDPDVILADDVGPLSWIAITMGKLFRIPVIVRLGGNPVKTKTERIRASWQRNDFATAIFHSLHLRVIKFVLRRPYGYLVVSKSLMKEIEEDFWVRTDKIAVCPPPVDVEAIRGGDAQRVNEKWSLRDQSVVLTVTNLQYKGKFEALTDILPSMVNVLEKHTDAYWIIVGGGRYQKELQDFISSSVSNSGVLDRIILPGYETNVSDYYAAADIFVYASYIDGYPNVINEAQANELPVVANPEQGISDQVSEGVNGFLASPQEEDFEMSVNDLLSEDQHRKEFGKRGYRRVQLENSSKAVGERMVNEISRIMD